MDARSTLHQALRIAEIRRENATTKTFVLDGSLDATPGQFVMAWRPGVDEKPFSLAHANPVTLTVAAVGPYSQALHSLNLGDCIWLRGPLGKGYVIPATNKPEAAGTPPGSGEAEAAGTPPGSGEAEAAGTPPGSGKAEAAQARGHALLIGGGYGVAPLRFLAERLLAAGCSVSMIIGARSRADLLLVDAFEALGVPVWLATEDGSAGLHGLVTDAIAPALAATLGETVMVYACGPTGMLKAIAAICQARGLPVQLSWEAPMRCGIGLCGSCEVGAGWLACLDGPVFPFDPLAIPPS